jgi:4-amino-4-deoxy-L-arabinose transferase-like glycosyltransferase
MTHRDPQERIVLMLAAVTSVLATAYFFRTDQILLYGDAVAHINIARRVIDNLTPGPAQLGSVWLPLPHLLMLPFVAVDRLWTNGLAGTFPSMVAHVLATIGIFRLLRLLTARTAAWIGTLFFLCNPNLLYMQSTAMTESIYLAGMVWAIAYLCDFDLRLRDNLPGAGRCLQHSAIALAVCILTRYDGWFLAGIAGITVAMRLISLEPTQRRPFLAPALRAAGLCALAAGLWLAWNYGLFRNPLEFANGPYSAKAIAERTTPKGDPPYPGKDHPFVAALHFVKAAKLNIAEGKLEPYIFGIAFFGALFTLFEKRRRFALLLWVPLVFYALSIAYGAVPIFMPQWWPFSYYNVRYGLQLLPALVVSFALASHYIRRVHLSRSYVHVTTAVFGIIAIAATWQVVRHVPISLREARVNSVTRIAMEKSLAAQLMFIPTGDRVLMFTGEYSGALQRADFPFARTVNEGNFGIWQQALTAPSKAGEWVIATEGDDVSKAVAAHPEGLQAVTILRVYGKKPVTIYRTLNSAR